MRKAGRVRFWLEAGLVVLSGAFAILTLFWRDRVEALTRLGPGLSPDKHNGSLDWAIVAGLAAVSIVVARAARAEWRRPGPTVATSSV
jgi:hypothetical protein